MSGKMVTQGKSVAFVCLGDATDPNYSSGTPYGIRRGFLDLGCKVVDIFPVRPSIEHIFLPKRVAHRLCGTYYSGDREPLCLRTMASTIERRLAEVDVDFVFASHSIPTTMLRTKTPIVFSHDQSFIERLDYFPYEQRPPAREYLDQSLAQEREAFNNATLCVYPSERSVRTIMTEYGIPAYKLAMIPWGGNLPFEPTAEQAEKLIEERRRAELRILFVGVDWKRKGGDVVIEACRILHRRGVNLALTVIGSNPAIEDKPEFLTIIPYIDKNDPEQLRTYLDQLSGAHFLFVPSRAEAYGHVFCEAAALGVPSVARKVGGIATIIVDGVTGCCLPEHASAADFADAIQRASADEDVYVAMARAARRRYEETLNWRAFCSAIIDRLEKPVAQESGLVAAQA